MLTNESSCITLHYIKQNFTSLNVFLAPFKLSQKVHFGLLSEMLSKPPLDHQDNLLYHTVMATAKIIFQWSWEEQFEEPDQGPLLYTHLHPCQYCNSSGMLRGLFISQWGLPAQCHTKEVTMPCRMSRQTTRFGFSGMKLLKRSYVGMAVNELITIGLSVFVFARIYMIHELLIFLLLERSVK